MRIEKTEFRDLLVVHLPVFGDERGRFQETFKEAQFRIETGFNITFVQDNESLSSKGVLRGLHAQKSPKSQAKLLRVVRGSILDVVVDLRRTEPTFGKSFQIELKERDGKSLFIPEGFVHGFYCHEDQTIVQYKCTNYYDKNSEICLNAFDTSVNIHWPEGEKLLSEKDQEGQSLEELSDLFF
ncbi:MAG: dTDP-4-dehydrorhamnose 3,5-epimerase [Flavobacteriales bacterium]|jgi:dTDP-4-dehydrorhamnose 3,5-epimerase|nr:dTDP-4-dehydrorhamnose 3,5-epimerase [Flavobacteriales bacterium]